MESKKALKKFINDVEMLSKKDYGDFKRRVGLDIEEMERHLGRPSSEVKATLNAMKRELLYSGESDVEKGRLSVLKQAHKLLNH